MRADEGRRGACLMRERKAGGGGGGGGVEQVVALR